MLGLFLYLMDWISLYLSICLSVYLSLSITFYLPLSHSNSHSITMYFPPSFSIRQEIPIDQLVACEGQRIVSFVQVIVAYHVSDY